MPKIILPPDAFDDMPDDDDAIREEPEREYDDFRERCELDLRYEREERFAAVLNDAERIGGAL